jgi:hypothetical protein
MQIPGRDARKKRSSIAKAQAMVTTVGCAFAIRLELLINTLERRGALFAIVALFVIPSGVLISSFSDAPAQAATSNQLNFQGRLLDASGSLVADGDYHLEFKLYDSLAAGASAQGVCVGGGTDDCLWVETRSTGNLVSVQNGYFSVYLGDVTALPTGIDWSQDLFLTMNVGGTGAVSWDGEMTPRFKLTAVPYAFRASNVASSDTSTALTDSDDVSITTGDATGTAANTGDIIIDTGSSSNGTAGTISLGSANASGLTIGRSAGTLTVTGNSSSTIVLNGVTISATELNVLDNGIEAGDIITQGTATDEYCLTYETGGGALFEWQACGGGGGSSLFTQGSGVAYLTTTSDTLLVGASSANGGKLEVLDTSEQLRLSYDASNYASFTTNSSGNLTIAPSGDNITVNGHLLGANTSTATTATTSGTGTNTTTLTFSATTSFANNDVIFIDNAGQDYYTRIVSGGTAATVTVSPAVTFETGRTVTKYNIQNIGATATDYSTQTNRFFQGYFLGGVVTGAGSTTLSDGRLASTGALNLNSSSVVVQNTSNSTTSLNILNNSGVSQLRVDTTNSRVVLGSYTSSAGWSTGASYGTAEARIALVESGGSMYQWGGRDSGGFYTNNMNIYDIAGNTWSTGASGGTSRQAHLGEAVNGKIYYWGGFNNTATVINTLDIYDIAGNTWTTGTAGGTPRVFAKSILYNGKIYIWGGYDGASTRYNTVDIYDIATDSWSTGTAGGTARTSHEATVYDGKMYIWGGNDGSSNVNTVDIYNIVDDSWSTGSAGGTARGGHSQGLYNGRIHYWGGYDGTFYLNTMDIYNIASDTWSVGTAGGTARSDHDGVVYDGKFINWGGRAGSYYNTTDIYTFGTETPTTLVLGSSNTDASGSGGALYFNTSTNSLRCYSASQGAWNNCVDNSTSSGYFQNGGNAFSNTAVLGTSSNQALNVVTNNTTRLAISAAGSTTIYGGTSGSALTVNNSTSTGNVVNFQDNGTNVATIADGGVTSFRNSTNSTSAFQVQNAAGTQSIFNVDTTNNRVGIGTATPSTTLEVSQASTATTNLTVSYNATPLSSTTAYSAINFSARDTSANSWTTSYDTSESIIFALVSDNTNEVLYAGTNSSGLILRCAESTGCDASGDWTTAYDTASSDIRDLYIDEVNGVLYAGAQGGIIYRCELSTNCDASGDFTTVLDTAETYIMDLAIDTTNSVLYAVSGDNSLIYRCELSTNCDASGDFTTVYDHTTTRYNEIVFDDYNGVLYAAAFSTSMSRCDVSTSCDESSDWSSYTPWTGSTTDALEYDPINHILYGSDATGGIIYRCDTTTSCDSSGDWTVSYDTPQSTLFALYVDTVNERLYAGSSSGGFVYVCPLSTECDSATDWSTSFDSSEQRILDFALDETNNILYAGSYTNGIIYRLDSVGTLGSATNFSTINSYATDTTNATETGALGFTTLVSGTAIQGFYLQGGDATLGNLTNAGSLAVNDGSGNTITLQSSGAVGGDYTLDIPAAIASNDTICLLTLNNCGAGATGFVDDGNSFGNTAVLGTNDNFGLNFEVNNTTIATISNTGQTVFQNATNSTNAFQVQNAAGTQSIFNVDTVNNRVGIGTAAPSATLEVSQAVSPTTNLTVSYEAIPLSTSTAFSSLNFESRGFSSTNWTTSYDTSATGVSGFIKDEVNDVVYVVADNIYRCDLSTNCDSSGDWTTSYTVGGAEVATYGLTIDTVNNVLYSGTGVSEGLIIRCDLSTNCDAPSDWATSYDTAQEWITNILFVSSQNALYATSFNSGVNDAKIFRCQTSTGCDASGDWTESLDTSVQYIIDITVDTANGVIYASGSDNIYRCDLSTNCDASGDWTVSTGTIPGVSDEIEFEIDNQILYVGSEDSGKLYRCDTSTNCDASGDWALAYDTTETGVRAIEYDQANGILYIGTYPNGIIYSCLVMSGCDEASDFWTNYDSTENMIRTIQVIPGADLLYAGSSNNGIIFRLDSSDSSGTPLNYAQIQSYATDTSNASEDGALGFSTLVNGTAVQGFYLQGSNATFGTDTSVGSLTVKDGTGNNTLFVDSANRTVTLGTVSGTNSWSTGTNGGTARRSNTATEYDGNIYYWGGMNSVGSKINSIDIYDIDDDSWSTGTSGGTARDNLTGVEYNGKIYFWAGRTGGGGTETNVMDIYDIAGDSWSTGTSGGTSRYSYAAAEYGGKIYYAHGAAGSPLSSVDIYDIAGDSWSTGTSGGTARVSTEGVVNGGLLYLWGGCTNTSCGGSTINTLDIYNIAGDSWSTGTSGGTARRDFGAAYENGNIYYWSGENSATAVINTLDVYNISGDSWSTGTTGGTAKKLFGGSEYYNGRIYSWGGYDGATTYYTTPEIYQLGGATPTQLVLGTSLYNPVGSSAGSIYYNTATNSLRCYGSGGTWNNCTDITGDSGSFVNGGNAFTSAGSLGTTTAQDLNIITSNTTRLSVSSTGSTTITGGSTGDALTVNNSTSTSSIFRAQDNGINVVTIFDGGATTLQNSVDSTGAFLIQNAAGTRDLLNVDTANNRVVLGTDTTSSGWSTATSGGTGKNNTEGVVYGDNLYVWGGWTGAAHPNTMDIYNFTSDSWSTGTSGGTGRQGHSGVEYGGKIYYFGGYIGGSNFTSVDIYDIAGDSWSTGASGGVGRRYASANIVGDKVYIVGGYTGAVALASMDVYDISDNSWSTGTAPSNARYGHTSVIYDGSLYVWSGYNGSSIINDVEIYNFAGDSWSAGTSGGTGRLFHEAVYFDGKLYNWGGNTNAGSTVTNTMDIYDLSADSWSVGITGGTARDGHAGALYDGKFYNWGGWDGTSTRYTSIDVFTMGANVPTTLVLGNSVADPSAVNGGLYFNTNINGLRCYSASLGTWNNCVDSISSSGFFQNGGNAFTNTAVFGTTTNQALNLITNNTTRLSVSASGDTTINGNLVVAAGQSLTLTGGNTASRPGSPTEGMLYFDTDTDRLLTYANGKWRADSGEYTIVAATDSTQAEKDSADYVADGTADQTEINSALTAASGGKVLLLAGTYTVSGTITIPSNTTLQGIGSGSTIFSVAGSSSFNLIENSDQTGGNNNITIRNLKIDGNKSNVTSSRDSIEFENVGSGSDASTVVGAEISNVTIEDSETRGIELKTSSNVIITASNIYGSGQEGVYAETVYGLRLTDSLVTGNSRENVYLATAQDSVIDGNIINGTGSGYAGVHIQSSSTELVISNNTINNSASHGVFVNNGTGGSSRITIEGNIIHDNGDSGVNIGIGSAFNVIGNNLNDNDSSGTGSSLTLSGNANSMQFIGNYINESDGTYGISIHALADDTYIADNYISATNGISDSGTDTIYGGQMDASGNFSLQAASGSSIDLLSNTDITGNLTVSGNTTLGDGSGDTLTVSGDSQFNGNLVVGNAAAGAEYLILDSNVTDEVGTVNGSMYYDTTLNKFRCRQNGTWRDCISADGKESIELTPEFTGAIFQGDGTNNTGSLTSGFCSGTSRKSINTAACGASDEHAYYQWTTTTGDNDYDIYVRYKMPSDFGSFESDTTIAMSGWRTDATNNKVELALFQENDTQCGTTTEVATGTAAWTTTSLSGSETGCTIAADDVVIFRIRMTATGTEFVRAGSISFTYNKAF